MPSDGHLGKMEGKRGELFAQVGSPWLSEMLLRGMAGRERARGLCPRYPGSWQQATASSHPPLPGQGTGG